MEYDYSYSQLPADEHAEFMVEVRAREEVDREKERKRMAKACDFHWRGGMF